jgi:uncharacterized phosphosugar-binding protein
MRRLMPYFTAILLLTAAPALLTRCASGSPPSMTAFAVVQRTVGATAAAVTTYAASMAAQGHPLTAKQAAAVASLVADNKVLQDPAVAAPTSLPAVSTDLVTVADVFGPQLPGSLSAQLTAAAVAINAYDAFTG